MDLDWHALEAGRRGANQLTRLTRRPARPPKSDGVWRAPTAHAGRGHRTARGVADTRPRRTIGLSYGGRRSEHGRGLALHPHPHTSTSPVTRMSQTRTRTRPSTQCSRSSVVVTGVSGRCDCCGSRRIVVKLFTASYVVMFVGRVGPAFWRRQSASLRPSRC